MKNDQTDNICEILEEQALTNGRTSMNEWDGHARNCKECAEKIKLLTKISESIDKLDLRMGKERMAILGCALQNKRQTFKFQFLYKYAAAAAIILVCFIVIDYSQKSKKTDSDASNQGVSQNIPPETNLDQEKLDSELAWDHEFDKSKATLRVGRLNRFRNESRRETGGLQSFKKRCREIKSKAVNLRNKTEKI